MKIHKRGTPPELKWWESECGHCLTVVRFQANDQAVKRVEDQRDGSYWKYDCPVCFKPVVSHGRLVNDEPVYEVQQPDPIPSGLPKWTQPWTPPNKDIFRD